MLELQSGAVPSLELVNVVEDSAIKTNSMPAKECVLIVKAWVKNLAYAKNLWLDAAVVDEAGHILRLATSAMVYDGPGHGDGDLFVAYENIFPGDGGLRRPPGALDPRHVVYRLYYEAQRQVYTDGIEHQLDLPSDLAPPATQYLLEGRLSGRGLEQLPPHLQSAYSWITNVVLFGYSFNTSQPVSAFDVRAAIEQTVKEVQEHPPEWMSLEVDDIVVQEGSYDLVILFHSLVTHVILPGLGTFDVPGCPQWAAGALGTGVLGRIGGLLVDALRGKLAAQTGSPEPGTSKALRFEAEAEAYSAKLAHQRGCHRLPTTGGIRTDRVYSYVYELTGCEPKRQLIVELDRHHRESPAYSFLP